MLQVRLYLDGNLLLTDAGNFEVIDDWPLHKTQKVHSTKLVIGACWQGGERTFKDYFRGYLAGLSLLKGKTESERVIKCLHNCKENLDFHALADMSAGTVSGPMAQCNFFFLLNSVEFFDDIYHHNILMWVFF